MCIHEPRELPLLASKTCERPRSPELPPPEPRQVLDPTAPHRDAFLAEQGSPAGERDLAGGPDQAMRARRPRFAEEPEHRHRRPHVPEGVRKIRERGHPAGGDLGDEVLDLPRKVHPRSRWRGSA